MSFSDTWEALNRTASDAPESRRRVAPDSVADLWLVLKGSRRLRTLRIGVEEIEGLQDFPSGSGINVDLVEVGHGASYLEVSLVNPSYSDVFDVFIADLANAATSVNDRSEIAGVVARRIHHWQAFLRKTIDGLSAETLRGLYGELKVLDWIGQHFNYNAAVACWVGPDGFSQDFHLRDVAIEVKTSAAKNPQSVSISSERQLDSRGLDLLALWHWSVDERLDHGETVPDLISRLRLLVSNSVNQELFENRLLEVGYLNIHASRYEFGYEIRSLQIFEVREGFPRLVEEDCPLGLGDVRYSVQLGAISQFEIGDTALLARIDLGQD
jgi:hypothetical protein